MNLKMFQIVGTLFHFFIYFVHDYETNYLISMMVLKTQVRFDKVRVSLLYHERMRVENGFR